MKHRGVEYTIVQGIGRHIWKWSVASTQTIRKLAEQRRRLRL
jgi:hypothetical protein